MLVQRGGGRRWAMSFLHLSNAVADGHYAASFNSISELDLAFPTHAVPKLGNVQIVRDNPMTHPLDRPSHFKRLA
jgi:hypothetical protein